MAFDVWAPDASSVDLIVADERVSMSRAGRGWWTVDRDVTPGTDYWFSVDGGVPRPDPRSPWQPQGPDGPSRTVDHDAFSWSDAAWRGADLAAAVIYELHVGTFTEAGTFEGAIDKLEHLVDLGVTAIELMPVAEFSGTHGWGYDGVDLYAPHHAYGGPTGLKRLVDACHSEGLAVVMDVVYNHLGPSGNYLREFGPYFTDRYATPWGDAINFDGPGSDGARRFFIDNALMWLRDYHCDGLRLDAVHAILDSSAIHILEEVAAEVRALERAVDRTLWVIAESDLNDPRVVTPVERGGYGLDAQWSDDFHHALHALLTGETAGYYSDFGSTEHLAKAFRNAFVYDGTYSVYRGRRHGRPPTGLEAPRFLGYLQNHDQVGNRAAGERTSALLSTELLKVGAALVLTSPFVPMLFQGEEWGASSPFLYFTDHADPALGKAVSEGRKGEFAAFGWDPADIPDPQDPATFERSKLDWSETRRDPHAELLQWHKDLIRLRMAHPPPTDLDAGEVQHGDGWLTYKRGDLTIACNLTDMEIEAEVVPDGDIVLASRYEPKVTNGSILLPPESVTIYASSVD
ncbi:MAG: malto-oligosyltrehalose trehalohydrolase [Actinobacteria bacterium]|nr:malto-oligosyltrehalose trehalohydrolase [Actinomycetota bacterium]